jgi:hypothetical protein
MKEWWVKFTEQTPSQPVVEETKPNQAEKKTAVKSIKTDKNAKMNTKKGKTNSKVNVKKSEKNTSDMSHQWPSWSK